jgi:hypothetical protein
MAGAEGGRAFYCTPDRECEVFTKATLAAKSSEEKNYYLIEYRF